LSQSGPTTPVRRKAGVRKPGVRKPGVRKIGVRKIGLRKIGLRKKMARLFARSQVLWMKCSWSGL
jgi:hypothetical protein